MAILNFEGGKVQILDSSGNVLDGGKMAFYEVGTTTDKDTFTTSSLSTANPNPVILDASGRATVWMSGNYDVIINDKNDVLVYSFDNTNFTSSASSNLFNLVINGSFETNDDGDNFPDSWITTEYSGGTASLDTSDQQHAKQSLKFVSTGSGGGYITSSSFIEVSELTDLGLHFYLKSSDAGVRNLVQILWYDKSKVPISTSILYDDSTTNPTSWTLKSSSVTVPSTARFAKLEMYGCHSSDPTSGSTWFDDVILSVSPLLYTENVFTATNYLTVGSDVVTAATVTLATDGNISHWTGTTTVADITHITGDGPFYGIADAIFTFTHAAGVLELPGKADITTAVDDRFTLVQDGTTWVMTEFTKSDGSSISSNTGDIVQSVITTYGTVATGTTTIPWDNTIPQSSEGVVFMTRTITPTSETNKLIIDMQLELANSAIVVQIIALFQDSIGDCLAAHSMYSNTADTPLTLNLHFEMVAGTTSEITFKAKSGGHLSGTTTFNGQSGTVKFGGKAGSYLKVVEEKV